MAEIQTAKIPYHTKSSVVQLNNVCENYFIFTMKLGLSKYNINTQI